MMDHNINNEPLKNASNPLASNLHVKISMPEVFDIEIVEASQLKEYELWAAVSSLMLNFVVGFIVAAATNTNKETAILLWSISGIFFLLFCAAAVLTIKYRKRINRAKQTVKMVASPEQTA